MAHEAVVNYREWVTTQSTLQYQFARRVKKSNIRILKLLIYKVLDFFMNNSEKLVGEVMRHT